MHFVEILHRTDIYSAAFIDFDLYIGIYQTYISNQKKATQEKCFDSVRRNIFF